MQSTYHITLVGGKRVDIKAGNAADAMGKALTENPGFKVLECFVGLTEQMARDHNDVSDRKAMPGLIRFEVPEHDAARATEKKKRVKEPMVSLFGNDGDAEIVKQSENAIRRV